MNRRDSQDRGFSEAVRRHARAVLLDPPEESLSVRESDSGQIVAEIPSATSSARYTVTSDFSVGTVRESGLPAARATYLMCSCSNGKHLGQARCWHAAALVLLLLWKHDLDWTASPSDLKDYLSSDTPGALLWV